MSRRTVLREQVKEHIVNAILNGEIEQGERVVESSLARELGISQGPVREAIRDLVMMGFLETVPYKGATVRVFSTQDFYEIYTVRAALESLAARQASHRFTEDDMNDLRRVLDEMIAAARREDLHETVRQNNRFHELILLISGNSMLHQLWKTLQFWQWTSFSAKHSAKSLEELALRHEILLEALQSRDPAIAMNAMRQHIEQLGPAENQVILDQRSAN